MAKRITFLSGLLLLAAANAGAEPKWIHVPSSDFEIFSTAGEGSTMEVLHHFEEVRGFFIQTSGTAVNRQAEPVRIIVFGSEKEYIPYRPSEAAAAFYTQIAGRDYIVLSGVSEDVFPIAVHEYVHLVAQHRGMNLPPWLNEGIADVYSTLKPVGKQILVGSLIKGHLYELSQNSWIPLSVILAADHNSPYYNEKKKAGNFYAESWALTHMLMLDPAYRPQFAKLLATLRNGGASQQVIESLYGKPLAAFDKEVQTYIRGDRLSGGLVPAKLDGRVEARAEPAQPFDVKLALLDLLEKPGKEAERRKGLTDLAAEYPTRSEPHSALGYLAWRTSNQPEAVKEFKAALDLGGRNPQMLWDYGHLAASSDAPDALHALSLLLALDAGRMDVRLMIAELQLNAKDYREALATLSDVKQVTAADAPRLFRAMALTQMNNGSPEQAAISAKRWKDSATDDGDRDRAAKLIEYLDAVSRRAKQAELPPKSASLSPSPSEASASDAPYLRRNDAPARPSDTATPVLRTRTQRPSVAGVFVEFDCSRPQPRFVLSTKEGNAAFIMDDPKQVFIRGRESDTIDLYCGKQKESSAVWIEYDPAPASASGAAGIARFVHFEAPGAAGTTR